MDGLARVGLLGVGLEASCGLEVVSGDDWCEGRLGEGVARLLVLRLHTDVGGIGTS